MIRIGADNMFQPDRIQKFARIIAHMQKEPRAMIADQRRLIGCCVTHIKPGLAI